MSKPEESSTASKLNPFEPVKDDAGPRNATPIDQPRMAALQVEKAPPPTEDTPLDEDAEEEDYRYLDRATD